VAQYDKFILRVRSDGKLEASYESVGSAGASPEEADDEISLDDRTGEFVNYFIDRLNRGDLDEAGMKLLGKTLYEALYPGKIGHLFDEALQSEERRARPLRVLILQDLKSPAMGWPLEFLRYNDSWLATRPNITLARSIKLDSSASTARQQHGLPLKLLVVFSRPGDLDGVMSLTIEKIAQWPAKEGASNVEVRVLGRLHGAGGEAETGEADSDENEMVEGVTYLKIPATFDNLRAVNEEFAPDIIHFIGHGQVRDDVPSIALINFDGNAEWCDADELREAISSSPPSLIVLQACETGKSTRATDFMSLATALVRSNIPAVVAMQFEVRNDCATVFATGFYEELAKGSDVDAAVQAGRTKISFSQPLNVRWKERHFGAPVLFMLRSEGMIIPIAAKNRQSQPDGVESPTVPSATASRGPTDLAAIISSFVPEGRRDELVDILRGFEGTSKTSPATKQAHSIENTTASIDVSDLMLGSRGNGS
jgi:hypothetical protein